MCPVDLIFFQVRHFVHKSAAMTDFSDSYSPVMDVMVKEIFTFNDENGDGLLERSEWRAPASLLPGGPSRSADEMADRLRKNIASSQRSKHKKKNVSNGATLKEEL